MNIRSETCVVIFLALLAASMLMQWMRATRRKNLVRRVDPAAFHPPEQEKWFAVERGLDFIFKDFRKLQIAKKNLDRCSGEFKSGYRRYVLFSRAEMAVTATMLIFGATAFLFCK